MILVVEDERRIRAFLVRGLTEEGFEVRECADGQEALSLIQSNKFSLVLLDWMLPHVDGIDIITRMRADQDTTPVIVVTAKDEVSDSTTALNAGADDFVVKPFAFDELLARIRAVLRRANGRTSPVIAYADLVLDPVSHRVTRAGVNIRLTAREFALLQFLLEHAGTPQPRTRIIEAVWEHDFETFSNVLDVYIRYLRTKVDTPFPIPLIHTVRGVGYVLEAKQPPA